MSLQVHIEAEHFCEHLDKKRGIRGHRLWGARTPGVAAKQIVRFLDLQLYLRAVHRFARGCCRRKQRCFIVKWISVTFPKETRCGHRGWAFNTLICIVFRFRSKIWTCWSLRMTPVKRKSSETRRTCHSMNGNHDIESRA
eukprot:5067591-Amphidinium_carterae.1